MADFDEVRTKVADVLVLALGVGVDDITPSATLIGDLGAESIDLLDIVFRLEREFRIRIPRGELFIEPQLDSVGEYVRDGRVTPEGLVALRSQMPFADLRDLQRSRRLDAITDLFTVDLVARYVTWKLEGGGGAGSAPTTDLVASGSVCS